MKHLVAMAQPLWRSFVWMIGGPASADRLRRWLRRYAAAGIAFAGANFLGIFLGFVLEILVFLLLLPLAELYLDNYTKRQTEEKTPPTKPRARPTEAQKRRWLGRSRY